MSHSKSLFAKASKEQRKYVVMMHVKMECPRNDPVDALMFGCLTVLVRVHVAKGGFSYV